MASPFERKDPTASQSVPSYDTSSLDNPWQYFRKPDPRDLKKLQMIRDAIRSLPTHNPFALARRLNVVFSHQADYSSLYSLTSELIQDDFSDGDMDALARRLNRFDHEMLDQISLPS